MENNSSDALVNAASNDQRVDAARLQMDNDRLNDRYNRAKELLENDKKVVPPFWVSKYKKEAARNWDLFYKRNTTKFFKDRHWTEREFEELADRSKKQTCLEIGCGVGNFLFPILAENSNIFIYACDFSKRAVDMVKSNEQYDESRCKAFVCDITADALTDNIPPETVDLVSAIFVFSAIPPEKLGLAIRNVYNILKPGGCILFRDYGLYDEAQLKFSAASDKKLDENLYVRQDGTMSYFFSVEDLQQRFEAEGFQTLKNEYIYRETTNRRLELNVDRIFVQAKFQKP
ncbi:S-adenosyl-L-methionine-dependent methyltransferase [Radiomyces spectabilis]|uniref:S-adenosyl-L-methionine-dependent methyltransferase n=1 Tax=Radiomyces spectabilis TaxID=64574 RepID=UPI002220C1F9|nr:S-adenosyl-L-methionine-dependent methyltransferase [Radiomyces spectabilis]KAI8370458.1 S-adenosyl-L-methionine-dependent methyltransferase [Radiomyces spectabilis]